MTTTLPPVKPLQFALMYRKEAKPYERPKVGKTWADAPEEGGEQWGDRDMDRFNELPETPTGFVPLRSTFPVVSSRADFLNIQQQRAGFADWFFYPEAIPTEMNPEHCAVCTRIRSDRDL